MKLQEVESLMKRHPSQEQTVNKDEFPILENPSLPQASPKLGRESFGIFYQIYTSCFRISDNTCFAYKLQIFVMHVRDISTFLESSAVIYIAYLPHF